MLTAIGIFLIMLFLGMPVAFAIGLSGVFFFLLTPGIPWEILVQKAFSTTQSYTMLAIPLFILAGNLMNNTGLTKRLVKLSNVLTGHMYGSIGQVSAVLSTLMGGVSGSAVADAAMESRILGPEMIARGYDRGWGAAVNSLTGLIVATIPPSMGLILYGTVGEVSIGRLFVAGFIPGIIMCIFMMIAIRYSAKRFGYKPDHDKPASLKEMGKAALDSIWALMFPIILIVLIRGGLMTPSESGAFAVFYALFIGIFIYKGINSLAQRDRTVSVRGLAEKEVKADRVIWPLVYKTVGNNISGINADLSNANRKIKDFLIKNGIPADEIEVGAPQVNDLWTNEYNDNRNRERYNARTVITVTSSNVDKVRDLITRTGDLLKEGIAIAPNDYQTQIKYSFTSLNKIKPEMIEEATKNAREAAEKFAKENEVQ